MKHSLFVEAVSGGPGRRDHPHLLAPLAEGQRGVLRAAIGMMDDPFGTALCDRKRAIQDVLSLVASVWWRFVRLMSESGGQGVVGEE